MARAAAVALATALLVLAGCATPSPVGSALYRVALDEPFDDDRHGWGGPFHRFDDGAYVWALPPGQRDVRAADGLISVEDDLDVTRTTATFTAEGTTAVGIECAYEESGGTSRWYELSLGTHGATISRQPFGQGADVTVLAEEPGAVLTATPTTITATCERLATTYRLALAVDGDDVVAAEDDDPFGPGAPGLVVRAAPASDGTPSQVRFDSFVVEVPTSPA